MSSPTPDGIRMDHVALASRHAWDQIIQYGYHLGGQWLGGPPQEEESPFYFCQLGMHDGTKLEFLEPIDGEGSDFLRRFLDRNGPGPHHFTFKVPDFDAALNSVNSFGYEVVGIDRSDPDWSEGFLHPKQSHGIVIQLAHHGGADDGWPLEGDLPPSRRATVPSLERVEHLVADLDAATKLFSGPLAMSVDDRGTSEDGDYTILTSGPWKLVLIQPERPTWQHWLGSRSGRLLRLGFVVDEPGTIPGARALGDGRYEVPPELNLGTRLVLRAASPVEEC